MSQKDIFLFVLILCLCFQGCWTSSERIYMEDECGKVINMEERGLESMRVELTKYQLYHNSLDCVFRVKGREGKRLQVRIMMNKISRSDNCTKDFLQIYDGPELINDVLQGLDRHVCSSTLLRSSYTSSGDYVTFRFKSDQSEADDGFRLLVTAFRSDPRGQCYSNEFQCESNKRCISDELECDHFEDCEDASDECGLSTAAVIGIAVGGVVGLLLIITIIIFVCCYRSRLMRNGSTKSLNAHDSSVEAVTPPHDQDIQFFQPIPSHHTLPATPQTNSGFVLKGPYYSYNKPDTVNTRHVWITAPPEVTYVSAYDRN